MARRITPVPLTRDGFAPFGEVIETHGAERRVINEGSTVRFHDLARVDVAAAGGYALINLFRAQPLPLPLAVRIMEQHPLGSQAFIPLDAAPFLIVVAAAGAAPRAADLRAFVTDGRQGVNYARGVWHHPVIAMTRETDFVVVDRGGPGDNLVEVRLAADGAAAMVQGPR
ncbi:MAG: ureidoglycolate lyase [Spirochaetaceae bacterium]|nr:ureidoglycolate lyase [Spirochaetaceae bacterium]